jgi:N-acyl homoserine lactone hydrolase
VDVDRMHVPLGLAFGSQENLVMATEAMMKSLGCEARRVTSDGLGISEVCLADGEKSGVR